MEACKKCFKCGEVKSLSAFYKHPQMPDGHVNKYKECNKRTYETTELLKQNITESTIERGVIE